MDLYREIILDHYKHPRNFGSLPKPDVTIEEGNVTCGDKIIIDVNIQNKKLTDIKFRGTGCAISIASASLLTEYVNGKTQHFIMKLGIRDVLSLLGVTSLTPSRTKCALLSLEVLQKAVQPAK